MLVGATIVLLLILAIVLTPLIWVSQDIGPANMMTHQVAAAQSVAEAMLVQQQTVLTAARQNSLGTGVQSTATVQQLFSDMTSPPYLQWTASSWVASAVGIPPSSTSTVVVTWYQGSQLPAGAMASALVHAEGFTREDLSATVGVVGGTTQNPVLLSPIASMLLPSGPVPGVAAVAEYQ